MRPNKFTMPTKPQTFYHISVIENKESILINGLVSEDSELFVCTDLNQLKLIAFNQLFINEYSIFEVSKAGITGKIINDNVAEVGAGSQFIIKQENIEAEYITHFEDVSWNYYDLAEESTRTKARAFGFGETEYIETLVSIDEEWREYYNKKYNKNILPREAKTFTP